MTTGTRGVLLFLLLVGGLVSCGEPDGTPRPTATRSAAVVAPSPAGPTPTEFVLPTLYPTRTPPPAPTGRASATPHATATPAGDVDFQQPIVAFRYTIPALGLDHRFEGNVSGEVTVVNEATGLAAIRDNQSGVLLELQEALPQLELADLPAGCETCVSFSYELPLEGQAGTGWLQDPVMLASVDNYVTATFGPHFPPGTVAGLHRTATAYDVAHTVALTAEGQVWRWLATAAQVPDPVPVAEVAAGLPAALDAVPLADLAERYAVECPAVALETMILNPDESGEPTEVRIVCPAFSLPTTLLPLYLELDAAAQPILTEQGLPRPPLQLPLATLLDYQRADGARLTLLQTGEALAEAPAGETDTAPAEPITRTLGATRVVSLTAALRDGGGLRPGVDLFAADEAAHILLVRGPQGMLQAGWDGETPQALRPGVGELDALLDEMLGLAPSPAGTPEATDAIGPLTPTPEQ